MNNYVHNSSVRDEIHSKYFLTQIDRDCVAKTGTHGYGINNAVYVFFHRIYPENLDFSEGT